MNLKTVTLADLEPHPDNPNQHPKNQIAALGDSLDEFDQVKNVVIWRGMMLAGHAVREAAIKSGRLTLDAVDVSHWDEEKATAFMLADIRLPDMGVYDEAAMVEALREVEEPLGIPGIDEEFLAGLEGWEVEEPPPDPDPPSVDKAEELQEKWQVKPGDIWQIKSATQPGHYHRLICGDCRDMATVEAVTDGRIANLMVADPPYGVDYDPEWRARNAHHFGQLKGNKLKSYGLVSNDDIQKWGEVYKLFQGNVLYVWHAGRHAIHTARDLIDAGFEIRSQIIWRKPNFVISRGHYHYQHEPCWYAVKKGGKGNWQGDRTQSTIWDIASLQPMGRSQDELDERTGHGTQKPIECMARPIRNNSKIGDLVYDPFLGSGTTLMACEHLGRLCRGIEISPLYVAVCLERYKQAFGIEASFP